MRKKNCREIPVHSRAYFSKLHHWFNLQIRPQFFTEICNSHLRVCTCAKLYWESEASLSGQAEMSPRVPPNFSLARSSFTSCRAFFCHICFSFFKTWLMVPQVGKGKMETLYPYRISMVKDLIAMSEILTLAWINPAHLISHSSPPNASSLFSLPIIIDTKGNWLKNLSCNLMSTGLLPSHTFTIWNTLLHHRKLAELLCYCISYSLKHCIKPKT